ncbi:MAG: hypothetical protein J8272_00570, partial ['Prunus persica' phytoplasma PP2]|nr:hypothetical protein ['Prunus persica' phytoplasma PP2]
MKSRASLRTTIIMIHIHIYIYIYMYVCTYYIIVLVSLHLNRRMEGKRKVCIMDECDKMMKEVEVE